MTDLHATHPIVAKFGGSSVADAGQVRKIAAIVRADPRRRFVVVSAPGKRHAQDKKITDLLYLCHSLGEQGLDVGAPFAVIKERYLGIASELGVEGAWEWLRDVQQQVAGGAARDWIASRGEYLSARIIAAFLDAEFLDAAEAIRFGEDGRFHASESYARLHERLARVSADKIAVIPGFYGQDAQGRIQCFSRGGSDVTGAVVARAVHAAVYENWTDVSGMLMADPRLVAGPLPIEEITYREQRELSYMGASVLHDEAVFPVREAGIPIHIRNTNRPDDPGTRIVTERDARDTPIIGIAGRTGFCILFTEKAMMNQERGYGRRVLEVLEAHGISYEHSPTSIDTMSVIVADEALGGKEAAVVAEIRRAVQPDRVEVQRDLAMIAIVGQGMVHRVGVAARAFAALAGAGINIRLINQGSSELNIIVGIAAPDYPAAVRVLYAAFTEGVQ
ncbi:MAG: aspartate kinase [Armatimonadetes bacterium]|nr:aspartate kinase [Armatimonadota bacterium]